MFTPIYNGFPDPDGILRFGIAGTYYLPGIIFIGGGKVVYFDVVGGIGKLILFYYTYGTGGIYNLGGYLF